MTERIPPRVVFEHGDDVAILHGDARDLDLVLDENSVDSIVCDPPAGIGFMAKGWDKDKGGRDAWVVWLRDTIAPAYRALKPGGHALVWALPRTSHWTATALEDAGFEIRDIHMHIFGTGFPKSLTSQSAPIPTWSGTALKPAAEHWILARKPLDGTVGENVAAYGTGILNIEGCRAEGGRWPAHVSLDEEAAFILDEQSGELKDGVAVNRNRRPDNKRAESPALMMHSNNPKPDQGYGGKGGASRFFYVAKGARSEKDAGLDHLPKSTGGEATDREDGSAGLGNPRAGAGRTGGARNFHPTVKSIALMRWLVRLVTPLGGVVLDPFAGSGSTGVAAIAEGFRFVGCELTDEYLPILEGRIRHALGNRTQ